ncbi:MAG TPA: hypothetical protein PLL09_13475 [Flavobacterium sp.]|mgnify:CR=1 FL=1|uniref:hypothetical protein n=1 Tax=unclassified Flavobacterium TaxID=196869 RepID=UPI0025C49754|nr:MULTISPECIES: hypothetical protein [unclassified Flavobacterium]HRE78822.1 hypothetical protein [Flavobacterium sp.]
MRKNTFKDYKLAIKEQYGLCKMDDVSGILANPTPAQLRTLCLLLSDKGLNKSDEEVFRIFFEQNENEALKRAINRINIDKFKTIISFLKGEKDMDNPTRIEIAAILVSFIERPYKVFSTSESYKFLEGDLMEPDKPTVPENGGKKENGSYKKRGFIFWIGKNKFITIFLIIASLLGGFSLSKFVFTDKQCMQWQVDHYEVVECMGHNKNSSKNPVIPLDKSLLNFRKIEVNDTTTFFNKQGKPLYWYCKVNGKPEFFNSLGDGFHPETGGQLKKVSAYIISNYVERKK